MELSELLIHPPETGELDHTQFIKLSDEGFSLVRLRPNGKEADREKGWQNLCRSFRSFDKSGYVSGENMGIAIGPVSDIICLDIDNISLFVNWCLTNYITAFPDTRVHKTPKGWHIFFRRWEGICDNTNRIPLQDIGCDIMLNRTQVVAPGSIVKKDTGIVYTYCIYKYNECANAPTWLIKLAENNKQKIVYSNVQDNTDIDQYMPQSTVKGTKSASEYLKSKLEYIKNNIPKEGERNNTLFKILSGARGLGANKDQIASYAKQIASEIGLPRIEAIKTADSAFAKSPNRTKEILHEIANEIPKPFNLTLDITKFIDQTVGEYELAKAIEDHYIDKYRYCCANKKWYYNNNNIWIENSQPDTIGPIVNFLKYYIDYNDDLKKMLRTQYKTIQSAKTLTSITTLLKSGHSKLLINESDFDNNALKLPLKNVIIEMYNNKKYINVRKISWDDYIRKTIPLSWDAPLGEYDADKLLELRGEGFIEFDTMLSKIFYTNPEIKNMLVKLLGYAISGTKDKIKKLPICIGDGNNGKSVLFRCLQSSLNPLAVSIDKSVVVGKEYDASPRPELLILQGTRLGFIGETEETDYLNESTVKALTGGDIRTARNLYSSEMVQLQPTYTIILATNHEPRIPSGGIALWNRILPIPFNTIFSKNPQKNNELPLTPGIWEWCDKPHLGVIIYLLNGWLQYLESGLNDTPHCINEYVKSYKNEEDPFSEFKTECLLQDENGIVRTRSLVVAYRNWCNDNQIIINNRIGDRAIKRGILASLKDEEVVEKRHGDHKSVLGIRFKPLFEDYAKPRPIKKSDINNLGLYSIGESQKEEYNGNLQKIIGST